MIWTEVCRTMYWYRFFALLTTREHGSTCRNETRSHERTSFYRAHEVQED